MRLWYQSLTRPDAWPTYAKALRRVLDAGADPGTEIAIHGIEKRGGIGDQYRYLEFIETGEVLENVARATQSSAALWNCASTESRTGPGEKAASRSVSLATSIRAVAATRPARP